MDKILLKKAAVQSVALMLAVITISYALNQYQSIFVSASDKGVLDTLLTLQDRLSRNSDSTLGISENNLNEISSQDIDTKTQGNYQNSQDTLSEDLNNNIHEEVLNQLGEQYLIIKKPTGDSISFQVDDLYLSKSVRIIMKNLSEDEVTSQMIGRVNNNELFYGDPISKEVTATLAGDSTTQVKKDANKDFGNDIVHNISINTKYDDKSSYYSAELLLELNKVYDFITYEDDTYYYINLRDPREVYDKIIVIDAGHGGKDSGAISKDLSFYEKDMNLDILLQLKKMLDQENIKVYYTRTRDDKVFLRPRVELANAVDCDMFISIHCNASEASWPKGTEIYYYNFKNKGICNKQLGNLFIEELMKKIPLDNRGLVEKTGDEIFILKNAVVPAILIEVGYITNNNDMLYIKDKDNHKAIASGIYNGIMRAYQEFYDVSDGSLEEK